MRQTPSDLPVALCNPPTAKENKWTFKSRVLQVSSVAWVAEVQIIAA